MNPRDLQRIPAAAYWLAPCLFCLALYWHGLFAWFQQDDFAWLMLLDQVREGRSLLSAIFQPSAVQGSLRPLGERCYYLGLRTLFGMDPFPFRALAFLVQFANIALVTVIVRRVTGSRLAGAAAAVFWIANCALFIVMTWSAEFMLILCVFFLLLALDQFQRYSATGARRHLAGCWAAFLLGFGALESNVIFPLLAASWAFLFARKQLAKTLPMFGVSALYTVINAIIAPKMKSGVYAIQVDWRMLKTLWTYWQMAFSPETLANFTRYPRWVGPAGAWMFTAALAAYAIWQFRRGRKEPIWFLGWFFIAILPVLPLPEHISEYYLTLPLLGLAMLGGDAMLQAWHAGWKWRALAGALAVFYFTEQVGPAYKSAAWWHERSVRGRLWLETAREARRRNPDSALIFSGLNEVLFFNVITNPALALFSISDNVWLAPGTEAQIERTSGMKVEKSPLFLTSGQARGLLARGALVFHVDGRQTMPVEDPRDLAPALREVYPSFVLKAGDIDKDRRLGEGWYPSNGKTRWMDRRSTTWIACSEAGAEELLVMGYATSDLLSQGPAYVSATIDGRPAGSATISDSNAAFELRFPLPAGIGCKERVELRLECDRRFRPASDPRDLSLLISRIVVTKRLEPGEGGPP